MCLFPRLVKNPKYIANKKNKGVVPKMHDPRVALVPVGCGNCMECMKKKKREWSIRLKEHLRDHRGIFITLSFSEDSLVRLEESLRQKGCTLEGYDLDNEMANLAQQRFSARYKVKFGKRPHKWLVTELGHQNTERIHLHGILFDVESDNKSLEELWKYGNVWIGPFCNGATANYITKYLIKTDPLHKEYKPRIWCSPGIGKGYVDRMTRQHEFKGDRTIDFYRHDSGSRDALPIYYRNKLFTEREREELWCQKLDKQLRFVNGIKIDISQGDEKYYSCVYQQRKVNKELGYGNDEINWDRRFYERQRRMLKRKERIKITKCKEK